MTLRLNLISGVALVLFASAAAFAQTAVLRGRVVDPMRAAVAAARVIAVAAPGGSVMTSISDAEGRFELTSSLAHISLRSAHRGSRKSHVTLRFHRRGQHPLNLSCR